MRYYVNFLKWSTLYLVINITFVELFFSISACDGLSLSLMQRQCHQLIFRFWKTTKNAKCDHVMNFVTIVFHMTSGVKTNLCSIGPSLKSLEPLHQKSKLYVSSISFLYENLFLLPNNTNSRGRKFHRLWRCAQCTVYTFEWMPVLRSAFMIWRWQIIKAGIRIREVSDNRPIGDFEMPQWRTSRSL